MTREELLALGETLLRMGHHPSRVAADLQAKGFCCPRCGRDVRLFRIGIDHYPSQGVSLGERGLYSSEVLEIFATCSGNIVWGSPVVVDTCWSASPLFRIGLT